jgi:hypothetical protein
MYIIRAFTPTSIIIGKVLISYIVRIGKINWEQLDNLSTIGTVLMTQGKETSILFFNLAIPAVPSGTGAGPKTPFTW